MIGYFDWLILVVEKYLHVLHMDKKFSVDILFHVERVCLCFTGVGSRVVGVSLLSECLMELSNCLQLHILKRFIFLLVGRQDNLTDNFEKCSLGCRHVLEDALALLNCMDAFSSVFTPHRASSSLGLSTQAYLWKGFTCFNKKEQYSDLA